MCATHESKESYPVPHGSHTAALNNEHCSFKLLASLFILYDILLLATPEVLSTVLNSYAQCSL